MNGLDTRYAEEFSEGDFWDKVKEALKAAGTQIIYKALQLYYATKNPDCPVAIKTAIYAALGYFILPLDLIPDFTPVVGFSDDMLAIGTALVMANLYIDDEVMDKAKAKMLALFGDSVVTEL